MTGEQPRNRDRLRGIVPDEVIDALELVDRLREIGLAPVGYRLGSPYVPVVPLPEPGNRDWFEPLEAFAS